MWVTHPSPQVDEPLAPLGHGRADELAGGLGGVIVLVTAEARGVTALDRQDGGSVLQLVDLGCITWRQVWDLAPVSSTRRSSHRQRHS